jgi:hypothetical protein
MVGSLGSPTSSTPTHPEPQRPHRRRACDPAIRDAGDQSIRRRLGSCVCFAEGDLHVASTHVVVVRPGAHSGGDGLCQHPQPLAVLGGHAGRHADLDPHIAVDVVVLHRSSVTPAMIAAASLTVIASQMTMVAARTVFTRQRCRVRHPDRPPCWCWSGAWSARPRRMRCQFVPSVCPNSLDGCPLLVGV